MITGFSEVTAMSCCCGYELGSPENEKFAPNAWGEIPWRTGGIGFACCSPGCAPWVWGIIRGFWRMGPRTPRRGGCPGSLLQGGAMLGPQRVGCLGLEADNGDDNP